MQCKKCGKELNENAITCPICGTPVVEKENIEEKLNNITNSSKENENNGIALAGLLFSIFFGIIGLIISIIGLIKSKKVNNDGRTLAIIGIIISLINITLVSLVVIKMEDLKNNEDHRLAYCEKYINKQDKCYLKDDGKYDCIFTTCEFNETK